MNHPYRRRASSLHSANQASSMTGERGELVDAPGRAVAHHGGAPVLGAPDPAAAVVGECGESAQGAAVPTPRTAGLLDPEDVLVAVEAQHEPVEGVQSVRILPEPAEDDLLLGLPAAGCYRPRGTGTPSPTSGRREARTSCARSNAPGRRWKPSEVNSVHLTDTTLGHHPPAQRGCWTLPGGSSPSGLELSCRWIPYKTRERRTT